MFYSTTATIVAYYVGILERFHFISIYPFDRLFQTRFYTLFRTVLYWIFTWPDCVTAAQRGLRVNSTIPGPVYTLPDRFYTGFSPSRTA